MDLILILKQYWEVFVLSFGLGIFLTVGALRLFPRIGLLDRPQLYGLKRAPIPYYGGLAIYLGFVILVTLFVDLSVEVFGLLVAATVVFLTGFFDDLRRLSPWVRLGLQAFAAGIMLFSGAEIFSINLPFLGELDLGVLAGVFVIFWVLTVINTMNFIDGVGGLNSGVTAVSALTLFFLSVNPALHSDLAGQETVATLSLIVSGLAWAFLLFDFPRPRILMGDSGSTFFGFLLAVLAIFSGGKVATAVLVLAIPILDMIWVVMRRVLSGKKFWQGDLLHLHHRLLFKGLSERQVVLVYLVITAILGFGAAILVSSLQKFFMLAALIFFAVIFAVMLVREKGK